jgi:hypothetical protein
MRGKYFNQKLLIPVQIQQISINDLTWFGTRFSTGIPFGKSCVFNPGFPTVC